MHTTHLSAYLRSNLARKVYKKPAKRHYRDNIKYLVHYPTLTRCYTLPSCTKSCNTQKLINNYYVWVTWFHQRCSLLKLICSHAHTLGCCKATSSLSATNSMYRLIRTQFMPIRLHGRASVRNWKQRIGQGSKSADKV